MPDKLQPSIPQNQHGLYFHYVGLTDTGMVRDHNEDAFKIPLDIDEETLQLKGHLYVLADGMGGHQKGEVASEVTIRMVSQEYYTAVKQLSDDEVADSLVNLLGQSIMTANEEVMDATEGGGTTVVAALLHGEALICMNVGDSRAYLLRDDTMSLISKDHSLVSRLVEMGKITEEQALTHPRRNVLYQALGQGSDVEIFDYQTKLKLNDIIILCSDGLWGEVPDRIIEQVLAQSKTPLESAEDLITLANQAGGNDNITAIIIEVCDSPVDSPYQSIEDGAYPPSAARLMPKPDTLPEGDHYVDQNE
ncbi:protein phosphatase 2C domain-containing protein [Anaerolineales bacterium HSG6]|nr:protein phosphatase 2C domain-containing protein [Anaerolineales bacterium HSG6]